VVTPNVVGPSRQHFDHAVAAGQPHRVVHRMGSRLQLGLVPLEGAAVDLHLGQQFSF
jgi:hypothetical protein